MHIAGRDWGEKKEKEKKQCVATETDGVRSSNGAQTKDQNFGSAICPGPEVCPRPRI